MTADVHALSFCGAGSAQTCVMNMVPTDDKGIAIPAVHRKCVIPSLENLAVFECDVVPPYEAHTRASALEAQASNGQVRTIHELNIVVPIDVVSRTPEQWRFSFSGPNDNWLCRRTLGGDSPTGVLRVGSSVQDELIARL